MLFRFNLLVALMIFALPGFSQQAEKKHRDTAFYSRSQKFYDSVYHKLTRHNFTRIIYNLAFLAPKISDFPDSLQVEKNEIPFNQYTGKIIRRINILTLNPFGPTVYDTSYKAQTAAGKAFNAIHMKTRKHVIRKNLLIHPGESLQPQLLADNERILRDINAIDNARIIVIPCADNNDSVDILVVTKDVWSIGFDVPTLTTNKILFRLYDANFLGLNDYLSVKFSIKTKRAPFYRFDGGSYEYKNIAGTFIDGRFDISLDDDGNQSLFLSLNRNFLTNYIKWAGGLSAGLFKRIFTINDTLNTAVFFNDQSLWNAWSLTPVTPPEFVRLIGAASLFRRQFTSRPLVTIDSNRNYYNQVLALASITISKNNYYLTDYITAFGKTENLPYGYIFQLTFGKEFTDFYQRLYSGITVSFGDFFEKVGYFQFSAKFGCYVYHSNIEDAVVKVHSLYFTPLKSFGKSGYKLRSFLSNEYRFGFNLRSNNRDYYNINDELKINNLKKADLYQGTQSITAKLSLVLYTPWYLYGFRFALYGQLLGGLNTGYHQPLYKSPLTCGLGTGVIIKNDNLVFPNFLIAGYFYPNTPGGNSMFQGVLTSAPSEKIFDFNVAAPRVETMGN